MELSVGFSKLAESGDVMDAFQVGCHGTGHKLWTRTTD